MYEIFLNFHLVLSLAVVAPLYSHFPGDPREPPTLYVLAAGILFVSSECVRLGHIVYRNKRFGKPLSRATVREITFKRPTGGDIPLSDAVHLHVPLSRSWTRRAGQYVYLRMPGVSLTSFAQLHPYYVAWWYSEDGHDYAVFILQKRRGFTDSLYRKTESPKRPLDYSVWLEGPYGADLSLGSYGTVLLFATGIGIAGQLAYVSQLLQAYSNHESMTRTITLSWQLNSEGTRSNRPSFSRSTSLVNLCSVQTAWVADRMQQLLKQDVDKACF